MVSFPILFNDTKFGFANRAVLNTCSCGGAAALRSAALSALDGATLDGATLRSAALFSVGVVDTILSGSIRYCSLLTFTISLSSVTSVTYLNSVSC
jgi:hypothetical protein